MSDACVRHLCLVCVERCVNLTYVLGVVWDVACRMLCVGSCMSDFVSDVPELPRTDIWRTQRRRAAAAAVAVTTAVTADGGGDDGVSCDVVMSPRGRRLSPTCTGSPSAPYCASCAPLSPLVYDTIGPNNPITRTALEGRVIGGSVSVRLCVRSGG